MALVCDNIEIESNKPEVASETLEEASKPLEEEKTEESQENNDLEDGEIEDDEDEEEAVPPAEPQPLPAVLLPSTPQKDNDSTKSSEKSSSERERSRHEARAERRSRHSDTSDKKKHMTEAEKSILHLRKRERMQREKWEKFRKEQVLETPIVDDFAINIEKAIASVLKKDKDGGSCDENKDDEKRARKRKNRESKDRRNNNKQRKLDSLSLSPSSETQISENVSSGGNKKETSAKSPPFSDSNNSYESDTSEERRTAAERKRDFKKHKNRASSGNNNRNNDRKRKKSRERRGAEPKLKNAQSICVFFLQGKCPRVDCPYSHEVVLPMKLELCKFYLNDCCAKGEKCSYMHSEFPCKFYHTGLTCLEGENCKFAHGKALSEGLTQILFKHIETAPREILGGFPRMGQDEVLNKLNQTQQSLKEKYGQHNIIPSLFEISVAAPAEIAPAAETVKPKSEKRNRPSRWQDPDPVPSAALPQVQAVPLAPAPFPFVQDQDMRVTSNGDIDMRTLPPQLSQISQSQSQQIQEPDEVVNFTQDVDIRNSNMIQFDVKKDIDIRQEVDPRVLSQKDVDIRQIPGVFDHHTEDDDEESKLEIDTGETNEEVKDKGELEKLPKMQRDLFLRIQAQQKMNLPEEGEKNEREVDEGINWYSDDDDDEDRLMIKVDNEEEKKEAEDSSTNIMSPPQIKPMDVVEKLGDLSKIDISAEVTKLLTSITQTKEQQQQQQPQKQVSRDPRQQRSTTSISSTEQTSSTSPQKQSIYEQGSITTHETSSCPQSPDMIDTSEMRQARPDVDLRNFSLPFKAMMNYTPAKEIDASVNSHPPIFWRVAIVDIPRPDYTGLKLNIQDAEKTGDPRLKKIFRLTCSSLPEDASSNKDTKDSPASPKAATVRIDPRLKSKQPEEVNLTYNQQLNILQSSAFFQSLTSNQKVLLNQELATRNNDQNGSNDPVLNSLLSNLNLIPNSSGNLMATAALNILANVNNLIPGLPGQGQQMVQPGLLGAAPGIPNLSNLPPNINFDPRSNLPAGILGTGPMGVQNQQQNQNVGFGNFQEMSGGGGNYQFDDYYQQNQVQQPQIQIQENNYGGGGGGGGGHNNNNRDNNRNFNRDRRRGGRNNFNRNGNRNFRHRNNRSNRSHTSP